MFTVNNLFSTALRVFSGVNRSSFSDPNGVIADAIRTVASNVDLIEAKRVVPLTPALYVGDNLYQIPDDVSTITDISPAGGRRYENEAGFTLTDPMTIARDYGNTGVDYAIEYRMGLKLLRVQPGIVSDTPVILHDCNSLTDGGAVTASGDAGNLGINTVFYLNGSGAIDFDITPSTGNAYVTFTLTDAVDITSLTRDGSFTAGIYVPEDLVGKVTSISIRVGSSASDYYQMTATKTSYGGNFVEGYNIVRFERRIATVTGTPVDTAIDYIRVGIAHTATTPVIGVKIDAVAGHKGLGYNLSYYSQYRFISETTGLAIEFPTNVGLLDKVVIDNDAYDLVVNEARKLMDMEIRGEAGGAMYKLAERELRGIWGDFSNPGLYERYRLKHPSERRSMVTEWTN